MMTIDSHRAGNIVLVIISFSILMVGCASLGTSNSDGVRYFSFEPPQGTDWRVLKNTFDALTLFREAAIEDESYVISIQAGNIPPFKTEAEFIEAVDKSRLKSLANMPRRYKSLESKIDPGNDSDFCFDSYAAVEDHEAKRKSSRTDMMISETASRTCRHPSNPNIVVNIYLSYRHYPADKDPDFMAKAHNIFTALKYQ
jgi:hypothetical protein